MINLFRTFFFSLEKFDKPWFFSFAILALSVSDP